MAVKTAKPKHVCRTKTGTDQFWYFLVVVVAIVFVLYTNAISFDETEGKLLAQIVPVIASVFGFSWYRTKKEAEITQAAETGETPDGANET